MKRIFRFLLFIFILLFLGAWIFPLVFKDAIIERVKSEANAHLDAELNFESVDLSLISSFPYFGFSLEGLSLEGKGDFEGKRLAEVGDFGLKIDLMSVISGKSYQIEKIELSDVYLNLMILENGKSNFDILKADSSQVDSAALEGASSPFNLALRAYSLKNFNFHFLDQEADLDFSMYGLNHSGSGDFSESTVALETETEIASLNFIMEGISYLRKVQIASDFDLKFDQEKFAFEFGDNSIRLNDLNLNFKGGLEMPGDSMLLDLKFEAPSNALKDLISLIPAYYYQDFEALMASGDFNLLGAVKGVYHGAQEIYPAFVTELRVRDGYIQYPDLPSSINRLTLDLTVSNKSNKLEATIINLSRFTASIAGSPVYGNFKLGDQLGDPTVVTSFKGDLDMLGLMQVLPMPGYNLSGNILADFAIATKLSYVEKEMYDRIKASGTIEVLDFKFAGDSVPMPLEIRKALLGLSPQSANLSKTHLHLAHTDLFLDGSLDNMLAYAMSDDEPLQGSLNLYSSKLDMADFRTPAQNESTTSTADSSTLEIIRLPHNVNLDFKAKIDEFIFDSMTITNMRGNLKLKEAQLSNDLSMDMLGGKVALDGFYDSKPDQPKVNFNLDLKNCSFSETYKSLDLVKSIAPIMENLSGNYICEFAFTSDLNSEFSPVLSSLKGKGLLKTSEIVSSNAVMTQLANFLNNPKYENIKISEVAMNFEIKEGKVNVKPFDFKLAGQKSSLGGSMGLDQSLDFDLKTDLPLSAIKASSLQSRFSAFNSGVVPLNVEIGGTATQPKVKPNLGDIAGSLVQEAKEQVKAKVEETVDKAKEDLNKKIQALVKEAEAKGDALIAQAEAQAAKIKAEAKTQADKIRKGGEDAAKKIMDEAGSNPLKKMAARPLADKAKSEADAKAQQLEDKASQEADKLIKAAHDQKQKLVEDAQSKAQL